MSFLSDNFQFLEMKFSVYLNRRVFVMNGEECASDQDLLASGHVLQYSVILYTGSKVPDQTV